VGVATFSLFFQILRRKSSAIWQSRRKMADGRFLFLGEAVRIDLSNYGCLL
jgi:hypothetical protein